MPIMTTMVAQYYKYFKQKENYKRNYDKQKTVSYCPVNDMININRLNKINDDFITAVSAIKRNKPLCRKSVIINIVRNRQIVRIFKSGTFPVRRKIYSGLPSTQSYCKPFCSADFQHTAKRIHT